MNVTITVSKEEISLLSQGLSRILPRHLKNGDKEQVEYKFMVLAAKLAGLPAETIKALEAARQSDNALKGIMRSVKDEDTKDD